MIVLDTNVLSELMRISPAPQVMRWMRQYDGSIFSTSSTVAAELLYRVERFPKGERRDVLLFAVQAMLNQELKGRILPFDYDAAQRYALLTAERRRRGAPINQPDAQIAAVAQAHGAKLATRNTSDFAHCGIDVINPWTA